MSARFVMSMLDFSTLLQLTIRNLRIVVEGEYEVNPVLEPPWSADEPPDDDGPPDAEVKPLAILKLPIEELLDRVEMESSDIVVVRSPGGEFEVRVADESWMHPVISQQFVQMQQDPSTDARTREYLRQKIERAHRLMEVLEQRRATLLKIGVEIFRQQRDFLEHGPNRIAPLPLELVAHATGVPLATVTQAVQQKTVWTPQGVFALESFVSQFPRASDH